MNRPKLAWTIASMVVLTLVGCGEKKLAEPIPDTWAMPKQPGGNFRIERMSNKENAGLPQQNARGGLPEDTTVTR